MQRRELKRESLIYYPKVFALVGKKQKELGHLVDITVKGIKIISDEPVNPKMHYNLLIEVTLEMGQKPKMSIELDAESVWCRKDVNDDYWDTGFVFSNINENNQAIIEKFINQYRFNKYSE